MTLQARNNIEVQEASSALYTATLVDEAGDEILLADVDELRLTLVDVASGTLIRDNQDVLNTNNCTLHATSGLLSWYITPTDTALVGSPSIDQYEEHLATFTVTWENGTKAAHREILMRVLNLRSIPAG